MTTTSFWVSKPSTPFLLSGKNPTTPVETTGKFRRRCRLTSFSITNAGTATSTSTSTSTILVPNEKFISRFAPDEPRKGADLLVESLERAGVTDMYAYPGGAPMEIHQALTRSLTVRNILCRHEQGEIFTAEGYARVSGRPGVCIATSGPGATNLVSGLADALLDSVTLVAITGQVPRRMIWTDAFQETSIVEVTRTITKHNYLVFDVEDLPRIMQEAFSLAVSGRPGPVLTDIPKDIEQQLLVPTWDKSMQLHGFVEPTGIPVASSLMGLGTYPLDDPLSIRRLGMHGTVYENYAVHEADLPLAFGVRFDDPVTVRAEIVHIHFDRAEIWKNKLPHVSDCADLVEALDMMDKLFEERIKSMGKLDFSAWTKELMKLGKMSSLYFNLFGEAIPPENAMFYELTNGVAIITTGVGQCQMRAAQSYVFKGPRQWATSSGLGAMSFGFFAAKRQMWAAQSYGFQGPRQWATSSGLGAMGFGLPAAIIVCAFMQNNKKLGITFLEIVKKLLEIVELLQTGM